MQHNIAFYSPPEERRAGDEEGEEPHAEADVDREALRPHPFVHDGARDGEVAVDRDRAQAEHDEDEDAVTPGSTAG